MVSLNRKLTPREAPTGSRVIRSRHGAFVDTDDAIVYLPFLAAAVVNVKRLTLAKKPSDHEDERQVLDAVVAVCRKWLPTIDQDEITDAGWDAVSEPSYLGADAIAKGLMITFAERQALGLKTIGACDISKRERKKAVKEVRLERQTDRRRRSGVKPRAQFEADSVAALARERGVNRCQIYRWRKAGDPRGWPDGYRSETHIVNRIPASHLLHEDAGRALKAQPAQDPTPNALDRNLSNPTLEMISSVASACELFALDWKARYRDSKGARASAASRAAAPRCEGRVAKQ